jgi:hypothetical protein
MSGRSKTKPDGAQYHSDYDAEYWTSWCEARRLPATIERLRGAFTAAQARVSALRADLKAERVDALERKHGLSSEQCIWSRCSRKALASMCICAEHFLTEADLDIANMPLSAGLREYLLQFPGAESNA